MKGNAIRVIHQEGWIPTVHALETNHRGIEIFWYWLPVLVYAWVIAYISSLSSPEHHINTIIHTVNAYSPGEGNLFAMLNFFPEYNDKFYHIGLYSILGLLSYRAIRFSWGHKLGPQAAFVTVLCVTLYGCSDELHQWFTPNRYLEGWDVLADAFGGFLGVCVWEWAMSIPFMKEIEEHASTKFSFMRTLRIQTVTSLLSNR